jgi:serine/threonine protein phosphatase PrpC
MYKNKYLKYKIKYLKLKNQQGGSADKRASDSSASAEIDPSFLQAPKRAFLGRSNSIPLEYEEQPVYENSSIKVDSGYSYDKNLTINNKKIPYTEDAHTRFSFGNYDILIVADGHGGTPNISRKSVALAQGYFKEILERENNNVSLALTKLCEFIHDKTKNIVKGGSTFNMAVIDKTNNKLYSANLGDSVLLVLRNTNNQYVLLFKTHSHEASDLAEQTRIKQIHPTHQFVIDGPLIRTQTGLQPTRGFGDMLYNIRGIIGRIPEIATIDLLPGDLIIQSSDGLYESYNKKHRIISGDEKIRIPEIIEEVNKNSDIIDLPERLLDDHARKIFAKSGIFSNFSSIDVIKKSRDNNAIHVYKVKHSSRSQLLKSKSM